MIYLARILFLISMLILTLSLGFLGAKMLYQPYLPEALHGYWVETCAAIIFGVLLTTFAQLLGNDLIVPKKAIDVRADEEFDEFFYFLKNMK